MVLLRTLFLMFSLLATGAAIAEKTVAPQNVPGTTLVNAEQAIELIQTTPNLRVFDSRHQGEYRKGHIPGAISLLDTAMTHEVLSQHAPTKNTPLLFYCNGELCLRSSNAAAQAVSWGYTKVFWFRGGWMEWMQKEYPIGQ